MRYRFVIGSFLWGVGAIRPELRKSHFVLVHLNPGAKPYNYSVDIDELSLLQESSSLAACQNSSQT
jgi:hypothetical protein